MENLLQNIASGLWIVLGVYCFFGLRKWNKRFSELYDELKREVECFQTSDGAPVVHGLWVCVNKIDPISGYRCSKCRRIVGFDLTPYCPGCGAKMDGGGDDAAD